jgi:hypothetical protein
MNNYRGISILPILAKLFEKLLAFQIFEYFETNNLFYSGQHGFRKFHSCETALHELVSDVNNNMEHSLITMLMFIDFKKAFDTVDSDLLLDKLFHYGFDNTSLKLSRNYFTNRSQQIKLNDSISTAKPITLGVPQGSVLGPLFFLIYINDLAYHLIKFNTKLFADDTSLYKANKNWSILLSEFQRDIVDLFEWCEINRIDINYSKTYIMVITNKRVDIPIKIVLGSIEIEVVSTFKLLGVYLDNKLNFQSHIAKMCLSINKRLYSIKRLAHLAFSVRMQFFKTFILPCFDYCSSLVIYFTKTLIQKISNIYYFCLYKLFGFKFNTDSSISEVFDFLQKFNLIPIQYRLLLRTTILSQKINAMKQPSNLFAAVDNYTNQVNTRSNLHFRVPLATIKFGRRTYSYFATNLLNLLGEDCTMNPNDFKKWLLVNIKMVYGKILSSFEIFNIKTRIFIKNKSK